MKDRLMEAFFWWAGVIFADLLFAVGKIVGGGGAVAEDFVHAVVEHVFYGGPAM